MLIGKLLQLTVMAGVQLLISESLDMRDRHVSCAQKPIVRHVYVSLLLKRLLFGSPP